MGSHKASFTSSQGHCASPSFKKDHKGKIKILRQEGIGVPAIERALLHSTLSLILWLHYHGLWSISIIYLDLGVGNQLSFWFSWDLVGIQTKTKTKTKLKEKKANMRAEEWVSLQNPDFLS